MIGTCPITLAYFAAARKARFQRLIEDKPGLPRKIGRAGAMPHDDKQNATANLLAAGDALKGEVIGRGMPRHRRQEFLKVPQGH
ncbi:MAG: hypothetical protein ACRECP_07360 [Methylocella sp.]